MRCYSAVSFLAHSEPYCTYLLRGAGAAGFLLSADGAESLALDAAPAVGAVAEDEAAAGRRDERLVFATGAFATGAFAAGAFVAGALTGSLGAVGFGCAACFDALVGLGFAAGVAALGFGGVFGAGFGSGLLAAVEGVLGLAVEMVAGFLISDFFSAAAPLAFALLSAGLEASAAGVSSGARVTSSITAGASVGAAGLRATSS